MKPLKGFEEFTEEQLREVTLPDDAEVVFDEDNPPWTRERLENSIPIEDMPPDELAIVLAALPKTRAYVRGKQKAPTKVPVSLRLSPEVVEHYKAGGPGWQGRIDEALKAAIKKAG